MENWQKLVLDPAHHAALKNLEKPVNQEKLAEKTGLHMQRCRKILGNLKSEKLVEQQIKNGERKFRRQNIDSRVQKLQEKLESETIGSVREEITNQNFSTAKKQLSYSLPVQGETRKTIGRLDTAQKLSKLA